MNALSKEVRSLRKQLELSQEELAGKLNVSFATVNRWETGKAKPQVAKLERLRELVEASGISAEELAEQAASDRRLRRGPKGSAIMGTKGMEQMLWDAACSIRGEKDAPKFKDYLLPLLFIKRLSDVFDDEIARLAEQFGGREAALAIVEDDAGKTGEQKRLVRFYIPPEARWAVVSGREPFKWPKSQKPQSLGEQLTKTVRAIVKHNPSLAGVIDLVDFAEQRNGEREITDRALKGVIETFSDPRYRLGLADVEPDFLGRSYEYLLRKFAEGQGQSAGEFFTPTEVGFLIAELMRPRPGEECYDYACGSFGLLIKLQLVSRRLDPLSKVPLKLYGQELTGSSYAIARMNMVIHDMQGDVVRGDSMVNPKFRESDTSLKKFDIVVANPMWNQPFDVEVFETDSFDRFDRRGGTAPGRGCDWAWVQHTVAALKESGRGAVVLGAAAVTRGSGSKNEDRERNIRRWFVENDLVEGVVLLPDNIFYNTPAAGIILLLRSNKPATRRGKIVVINAAAEFEKGSPKNLLTQSAVDRVAAAFHSDSSIAGFSTILSIEDARAHDYNLSPARHVTPVGRKARRNVDELAEEISRLADKRLKAEELLRETVSSIRTAGRLDASDLPAGWVERQLGEVATFSAGRTPPRNEARYWKPDGNRMTPWVAIGDMRPFGTIDSTKESITQDAVEEVFGGRTVSRGTLLMSFKLTIGRVATLGFDACHNEAIVAIYPSGTVDQKYLEFFLSQIDYAAYQDRAIKGQTLNRDKIDRLRLLLPPRVEQERIAAVLVSAQQALAAQASVIRTAEELFNTSLYGLTNGSLVVG